MKLGPGVYCVKREGLREYPSPITIAFAHRSIKRTQLRGHKDTVQNPEVYHTMNGPSEFHVVGNLKDWNIVDRLAEIKLPTLVTSGRYDEATPAIAETVHRGIAGSEWVIFEHNAHLAHAEEPERYRQVLDAFLSRVEAQGS